MKRMKWPYNFINRFFYKDSPEWEDEEELIRSVDYVIEHFRLSDKEKDLVHRYYRQGQTYRAIGEVYSRSVENIRVPLLRAVNKMRENPRNRIILTEGITAYQASGDTTVYVWDLSLPPKIFKSLRYRGLITADQLTALPSRNRLYDHFTVGDKSIDTIVSALKELGLDTSNLEH